MKPFLCALALTACGGQIDASTDAGATTDAITSDAATACPIESTTFSWFISGSNASLYQGGHDAATTCSGAPSVSLRSVSQASSSDFATMMTTENAASFAGKRVRFRGWVRTDALDAWAGLWMRVDEPNDQQGAFDNMANRPIKSTTPWTPYDVVLDVAPDAVDVAFGVLMSGDGQAWLDGVSLEVVDDSVPTTGN
ncbi:MAG TPA: hypothetical protein VGH87_22490 [Polyangiaceae bacterium]|jgi:hypothetical protein